MILLQISAAQGPAECALAVSKALAYLQKEAQHEGVRIDVLEQESGQKAGTLNAVLISLEAESSETEERLAQRWEGSVQWICVSPFRPKHSRKNWFIGVSRCPVLAPSQSSEIRFETIRASGPGGQHVNKTESAVRATHLATGMCVKVQTERSQHANKRLAAALIAQRLAEQAHRMNATERVRRWISHHQVERGNPRRVFLGMAFDLLKEG